MCCVGSIIKLFPRAVLFSQSVCNQHTVSVTRTILQEQVQQFADLSGDHNYIHSSGDKSLVHGTFLLSTVSAVLGTQFPGPGSVVTTLSAQFINPCLVNTEVEICVTCERLRKISTLHFTISNVNNRQLIVKGEAKVIKKD